MIRRLRRWTQILFWVKDQVGGGDDEERFSIERGRGGQEIWGE